MSNYYDDWLRLADDWKEKCIRARKYIHEEELEWVRTKQDYKAALLCSSSKDLWGQACDIWIS